MTIDFQEAQTVAVDFPYGDDVVLAFEPRKILKKRDREMPVWYLYEDFRQGYPCGDTNLVPPGAALAVVEEKRGLAWEGIGIFRLRVGMQTA